MKKSTKTTSAALFVAIGLMVILSSCKKESEDNEEVTPSSRQLYEFSVPGVGFSVGCPTLVNNFIYIGTSTPTSYLPTSNNYFYKLDENLKKIWEYPLGNKQLRGPASLDSYGNIYFVVDSARTRAHGYAPIKILSLDNNGKFLLVDRNESGIPPIPRRCAGSSTWNTYNAIAPACNKACIWIGKKHAIPGLPAGTNYG